MRRIVLILCVQIFLLLASANTLAKDEAERAMALAKKWQRHSGSPIISQNGRVLFVYGESQPTVVCAVFSLCDISMQVGEIINTVNVGDTVRWNISPARVGEGAILEEHLIIKPHAAGLRTSLFIATNRRSYMIELRSHETDSMGKIGFLYNGGSDAINLQSATQNQSLATAFGSSDIALLPPPPESDTVPERVVVETTPVGDDVIGQQLDFNYSISGARVPWRPIRVYDDGKRTFIDFDKERVSSSELPVFLVNDIDSVGAIVNYRYSNGRIVVDGLFNRGTLILGAGKSRKSQKVLIRKSGAQAKDQRFARDVDG